MSAEVIVQLVMSLGVIPGLFIYLLFDTRKESKEQLKSSMEREVKQILASNEREARLLEHLRSSDETHKDISESVKLISNNFISMQKDVEYLKENRRN